LIAVAFDVICWRLESRTGEGLEHVYPGSLALSALSDAKEKYLEYLEFQRPVPRGKPSAKLDPIHDDGVLCSLSRALFELLGARNDGAQVVIKNIAMYPALYGVALAFQISDFVMRDETLEHSAKIAQLDLLVTTALDPTLGTEFRDPWGLLECLSSST
jgi:hypothetical protein